MADKMIRQTMFNFGEVDVTIWKRTDSEEYLSCAQSLLNTEVGTTGLAKKRRGTSYLQNVTGYAQANSRMYDFVDNYGNHYVVLSANGVFNVFSSSAEQAFVVTGTGDFVVTGRGTNVVVNSDQVSFVQSVPVPYQTGDLDNLDYSQDNDSIIFTSPNYAPGRLFISQYNGALPPTFAFEYLNIYPLPVFDFGGVPYAKYTVSYTVSSDGQTLTFTLGNIPPTDNHFNSTWINGQILGAGNSATEPIGYAIITAVGAYNSGAQTQTLTATIQLAFQATNYPLLGSQYSIRQPTWTPPASPWPAVNPITQGYPAKVLFYQNRLWLANTNLQSNTIFGSQINSSINFDVGTGKDTDAIVYDLGQTNAGSILWLNGGKQMEIYCQNFEFACPQDQNSGITPSTFAVRQQSAYGAFPMLKPITYINDSYYSTKTGKALVNFHYNGIGLTYTSTNVSLHSSHLVKQPDNRALLRGTDSSQDNFVYYLNTVDNTLTSFQFATEYKLAALSPIVFQPNVVLVDICTVDNSIYILKYYSLTEQYVIEQIDDSTRIDGNLQASMGSNGVVTGLGLYNGYTVQVVFNAQDYGQYLVSGGQITVLNQGQSGQVFVGLLYDVEIDPMYPFTGAVESAFYKQVNRIYVDYYNSLNFYINDTLVPYQSYAEIQAGLPLVPQTHTAIVDVVEGWNRFDFNGKPIISITQSSPFDLQILSIGYQVSSAVL